MKISDLVDMVVAANGETLEEYGVDLHSENLSVRALASIGGEVPEADGRNTRVTLQANGARVRGTYDYFYNRTPIEPAYPADSALPLDLSSVDELGLIEAIIATGDPELDLDLLNGILNDPDNNLTLHYNADAEDGVDYDAYVSINSLEHSGIFNIILTLDRGPADPVIDLSEILTGTVLNGFEQNVPAA